MQSVQGSSVRITLLLQTGSAYISGTMMILRASRFRCLSLKDNPMLNTLFGKRPHRTAHYQWKPAVDLSNPRVAAILTTFPSN